MSFAVGELVVLKTGGPAMLVIDDSKSICQWVEGGSYVTQEFPRSDLMTLGDWMVKALERRLRRG